MSRKIALSGIPSYFQRNIIGHNGPVPVYCDGFQIVEKKKEVQSQLELISNTGNYLISEGTRRALRSSETSTYFSFARLTGTDAPSLIDHINKNFDFFVFSTANIFNTAFSPLAEAEVLSKINIPIVLMSAGIQQRDQFGGVYPEKFRPLMEVLKDKQAFVFTRGHYTADFLQKNGISFAEAVGCPSIYSFPDNMKSSLRALNKLDFNTDISFIHSGYLGSVLDSTVEINTFSREGKPTDYILQDEYLIFDFNLEGGENDLIYDEASGRLTGALRFPGMEVLQPEVNFRVFFNADQWRAWSSGRDFSFGRRFHGMVIAAQAGIPSMMISVDDRTQEMLDYLQWPHFIAREWNPVVNKRERLQEFLSNLDVERHVEHYVSCESRFRSLLKLIGLV